MIAAEPEAAAIRERIAEGEKHPETCESATGCPGFAASSPVLLLGAGRPLATTLRVRDREMTKWQRASVNDALLSSAVGPKRSSPGRTGTHA